MGDLEIGHAATKSWGMFSRSRFKFQALAIGPKGEYVDRQLWRALALRQRPLCL